MTPEDIRQCEELTRHAQLGQTGSCLCGFKKYKTKPDTPVIYRCPFCGDQPEVVLLENKPAQPIEVFCATEGCVAFPTQVTLERWNKRATHEQEVSHIPSEEPIFILRAQDALALVPAYTWIDLAEKKDVNEEKLNSAVNQVEDMNIFQRQKGNKIPD